MAYVDCKGIEPASDCIGNTVATLLLMANLFSPTFDYHPTLKRHKFRCCRMCLRSSRKLDNCFLSMIRMADIVIVGTRSKNMAESGNGYKKLKLRKQNREQMQLEKLGRLRARKISASQEPWISDCRTMDLLMCMNCMLTESLRQLFWVVFLLLPSMSTSHEGETLGAFSYCFFWLDQGFTQEIV
ncbi:hypothetical protein Tcan_02002 [Toxocara canis]|uniref:Uncharacterized protein n=1 Tax=Toxocara canis TaxID=6265 RepID=A0A0B2VM85_TOXCA|nr:hypothetical protein Tcan_02002 [Toxocara canis]